jgi:hypothetical protein
VICRSEWDLLAGPMCPRMLTVTAALLTQLGHGGVAGEVAGVEAGVVGAAGAGLHLTGTRGGRTTN